MDNDNKVMGDLDVLYQIGTSLQDKKELFDGDYLYEYQTVLNNLEKNIKQAEDKNRVLSIGIVGAVKAGKSSFLNALIFDGEEYLPKAATPMTAALTKIGYAEKPKAYIHYYSQEDWDDIVRFSNEYDQKLSEKYEKYQEEYEIMASKILEAGGNPPQKKTIENYERTMFKNETSEHLQGAKELTRMVKDETILSKLGGTDDVDGDILVELNNYVGARGLYTPIVSYVELLVDNEKMKGIEIVDTPGLNDPIVSRGLVTKTFLADCDVVLLLSPCSHFMDVNTIQLMTNSLPNAGVKEILVIGSKLDSGILNEGNKQFGQAYNVSVENYRGQFAASLRKIKKAEGTRSAIAMLDAKKAVFVSSLLYAVSKKMDQNLQLDDEQTVIMNGLKRYDGFITTVPFIRKVAGFSQVKKLLNEVIQRKEEIISSRTSEMADIAYRAALKVLEKIQEDLISNRSKLEKHSEEELDKRYAGIQNAINSSRRKLTSFFETAALECEKNVRNIENLLVAPMANYVNISIQTESHDEQREVRTGFLGLRRDVLSVTVTDRTADTSQVSMNIESYIGKCMEIINNEFGYIIDKDRLCNKIKDVVIETFHKSGDEYSEDDILTPLDAMLLRIQIPQISIVSDPYIDKINTQFKRGYAKNEEIHILSNAQMTMLSSAKNDILKQLRDSVNCITEILNRQSVTFADEIGTKVEKELVRLKSQIQEKQMFIAAYGEFIEQIKEYKKSLLSK